MSTITVSTPSNGETLPAFAVHSAPADPEIVHDGAGIDAIPADIRRQFLPSDKIRDAIEGPLDTIYSGAIADHPEDRGLGTWGIDVSEPEWWPIDIGHGSDRGPYRAPTEWERNSIEISVIPPHIRVNMHGNVYANTAAALRKLAADLEGMAARVSALGEDCETIDDALARVASETADAGE